MFCVFTDAVSAKEVARNSGNHDQEGIAGRVQLPE